MPLTLVAPLVKTVKLEKADETGDTFATFRQATMKEEECRSALLAVQEYSWNEQEVGTVTRKSKWNFAELMRLEVFLTMVDCNIGEKVGENEDGTPKTESLFKFGKNGLAMRESEFKEVWGRLPSQVAAEILDACHKANPDWPPNPKSET